jgi:hypothetical protein
MTRVRSEPNFAPWIDDPDPPDYSRFGPGYWEHDDYKDMQLRIQKYQDEQDGITRTGEWVYDSLGGVWKEEDHPRGQPDNPGKFGPGGSSSKTGKASSTGRSHRATASLRTAAREKIGRGTRNLSASFSYANDLKGKIAAAKKANKQPKQTPGFSVHSDTQKWTQALKASKIAGAMATKLGFNPDHISYSIKSGKGAAADYEDYDGEIAVYGRAIYYDKKVLEGIVAHEINHHKYNIVAANAEHGGGPAKELWDKHMSKQNIEVLRANSDGISSYADGYWKADKKRDTSWDPPDAPAFETSLAINETLAEVADAITYDKRDAMKRIPAVWMDFYSDLNKAYDILGGVKAKTWGQQGIEKHGRS